MNKLDGKKTLITGAFEGIDFTVAQPFFIEGVELISMIGRGDQKDSSQVQLKRHVCEV